jgi:hypothetical protein
MTSSLVPTGDLQAQLRNRLKGTILDLIPDDTVDNLVNDVWQEMLSGKPAEKVQYGKDKPALESEVKTLIRVELRAHVAEVIKKKVANWREGWELTDEADQMAKDVLVSAPEAAGRGFMDRLKQEAVDQAISAASLILPANKICKSCQRAMNWEDTHLTRAVRFKVD